LFGGETGGQCPDDDGIVACQHQVDHQDLKEGGERNGIADVGKVTNDRGPDVRHTAETAWAGGSGSEQQSSHKNPPSSAAQGPMDRFVPLAEAQHLPQAEYVLASDPALVDHGDGDVEDNR
jgi:hypothetical protein